MADPQAHHDPLPSSAIGGRYQVGELLASGGMGLVYRGFDRLAQRPIAYKRLKIADESARSRFAALFRREYDTLAHLAHPNIVEAYEFGFDDLAPYYTMELLSGDDLARLAPLPVGEACRVLRDIASALALLHARRLVHRDISPSNVRLTADRRAKLIDFGALIPFGTPSEIVGTPAFTAPECLGDAALDARTDLYALGVLAYWTLTGRMCVPANTLDALHDAWKEPIPPPSHYVSAVPAALDELVLSLLRHEPVARPSSAAVVIERLTNLADLPPEREQRRVAYSYLQHPPLRGREQALSHLQHALRETVAGEGQILLLSGEQGLGRSALLRQLAVEAQLAGATVLRAQGGLHTGPFGAARVLVQTGLATFPDVARLLKERHPRAAQLAGPGHEDRPALRSTIDSSERQAQIASLLQEALVELSRRNPLVLLVDDAHALDPESLSLFASMLDEVRGQAILLACSARAGAVTQHAQAFAKLAANATCCRLTALNAEQVAELVSTMFGGVRNSHHFAVWLYDRTGGNPAHCIDLARLFLARGAIRYTIGTFILPYEFEGAAAGELHTQALLASLAGLSEQAERVAHLLGLHDGPLTTAQLASASSLSARDVLLALEELVQRGVAVSSHDRYSCVSEALRTALCGWRPEEQARAAHRALAQAFARQDQDVLEHRLAAARHLLRAGDEEAFQGARLLAQTSAEHQFAMATSRPTLGLLEQALQVLEARGVNDHESIGLLVPLSLAGFYGELGLQRRYLERAMCALSSLCGISYAQRLRRWLGPRLALWLGILVGLLHFLFRRRSFNRRSFIQLFESFGGLPAAAGAAAACVWDVPACYRMAAWLEPFEFASKRSVLYVMREFCLANAELMTVKLAAASERYSRLLVRLERPVFGLDQVSVEQLRYGCLHGRAQALVTNTAPVALAVAEELERESTFFAPHARGVRMTYHAFRGEAQQAATHRARAEALAFRGGISWSATSVLTLRSVQACIMTGDVVGMVHVVADLEQLAKLSESMSAVYELAQAHLEQLRGHPERAIPVYERVLATDAARDLPTYPAECALHAQALSTREDYAAAKALCLALLRDFEVSARESDSLFLLLHQQLALAEAGLGNYARAAELLEGCFEPARRYENPLSLGTVHAARARVAALAGDAAGFDEHFAAMVAHFERTENPCLIQRCDALRTQAVRLGLACAATRDPRLAQELDGTTAVETCESRRGRGRFDEVC